MIVGTIVSSLSAHVSDSPTLFRQHVIQLQINWVAMEFALIILLAVGSDYNLMLVCVRLPGNHVGCWPYDRLDGKSF
ncbi:hypothetical protein BST20_24555 [Mycobacterium branderi]|uniref:Membrane transport protein MMPL domain-containing protein n=1 Tax=Mycobacterium branderi TaxID=43348 RepID=A0AA91RFY9_9MYCO|nr:hypothetical protein BST20_24555 [Mycobacterium branderi]